MAQHWSGVSVALDPAYRRRVARELRSRRRVRPEENVTGPGHVVEFMKAGRSTCGIVTRAGRWADDVLGLDGKDTFVDHAKIMDRSKAFIVVGEAPHVALERLREVNQERDRLKAGVAHYELWEVAASEDRVWTIEELPDLWFAGEAGHHGAAALLRTLCEERAFARHGKGFRPLPRETVTANRQEDLRRQVDDAWLAAAASWLRALADVREATAPPDARHALELLASKVLFGEGHADAERASRLAGLAHLRSPCAIFAALVAAGYWDEDVNLDIVRQGIPTTFPHEALAEAAERRPPRPRRRARRVWLRRVYAFADEGEQPEVAFSIGRGIAGPVVGVHIAAPALAIRGDGWVHQGAADRAVAIRLPDQTIPMLPQDVIGQCALSAEDSRVTLTMELRFDRDLRLRGFEPVFRRVRVGRCIAEADAPASMDTDRGLQHLCAIASALRRQRIENGGIVLPEPWIRTRVTQGAVTLHRIKADHPARLVSEELCLLVNALTGRLCADRGIPALYHSSGACPRLIEDPESYDPVACRLQRHAMPSEDVSPIAAPHHTLGLSALTRIDRPLSRYLDLLMHEQITASLQGVQPPHTRDDLEAAALNTILARDAARDIERSARRYWLLRYMERYVGATVPAVVLEQTREGYRVELVETRLWITVHGRGGRTYRPGATLPVRITRVDARDDVLRAEPAI